MCCCREVEAECWTRSQEVRLTCRPPGAPPAPPA